MVINILAHSRTDTAMEMEPLYPDGEKWKEVEKIKMGW